MISEKDVRMLAWEAEWKQIRQDMELFPQNDIQKALLDILEGRIYLRWIVGCRMWHDEPPEKDQDTLQYTATRGDQPPVLKTMKEAVFAYWLKLECKFGIIFLKVFAVLTIPLLLLLCLIMGVQFQPLIYLLLIAAAIVMYFTPPILRSRLDCIKCHVVPMIATIYRFINSGSMSLITLLCLWIFTAFYYFALNPVVWAAVARAKEKGSLDSFEFAYLLAAKNLMK
jgi:hypothetical protein